MLEEHDRSPEAVQANSEIKQLRMELDKEHEQLENIKLKLQGSFLHSDGSQRSLQYTILNVFLDFLFFFFLNLRGAEIE